MRTRVRVLIAACLYYSGLIALARWWRRRSWGASSKGVPTIILNYHLASSGNLRRHLLYLRRHYRLLHLEEALEELFTPCKKEPKQQDRRMPLVVTFDDGYHDNYTHAFTLVRELQIPITIFLIPGYVQSGDYFWWREGKRLVQRAQVDTVTIEDHTYHLNSPASRELLAQAIDARLRCATSVVEREAFLAQIRESLAVPPIIAEEEEATMPLTWGEIHKMEESGLVSFGAHTMHHPILAYLADPAEVRREVKECRNVLERELGHRIRTIAYPIGKPGDYGEVALQAVQEAGYDWAITTVQGLATSQDDPYQIRRVSGDVGRHWLVMAAEISGAWEIFSPLWRNSLFGKR